MQHLHVSAIIVPQGTQVHSGVLSVQQVNSNKRSLSKAQAYPKVPLEKQIYSINRSTGKPRTTLGFVVIQLINWHHDVTSFLFLAGHDK